MAEKQRWYRRTETIERLKVRLPGSVSEKLIAERRVIEGGNFICQLFRNDGNDVEKLLECDIHGWIEIEQGANGEFVMRGGPSDKLLMLPEKNEVGDK